MLAIGEVFNGWFSWHVFVFWVQEAPFDIKSAPETPATNDGNARSFSDIHDQALAIKLSIIGVSNGQNCRCDS